MARRSYTSRDEPREPFELDGVEFMPQLTLLDLRDLSDDFYELDADKPSGLRELFNLFEKMLGQQYPIFAEHVRSHGTLGSRLFQIFEDILVDTLGPPQAAPPGQQGGSPSLSGSGSSGGRANGGPTSRDGSSSTTELRSAMFATDVWLSQATLDPDREQRVREAIATINAAMDSSSTG